MHFRLKTIPGKAVAIASLVFGFVLIAGTAFAALTFNSTAITSDGALTLNPTGQPVTVNGNLTVTGSCTGCGSSIAASNDQMIFKNGSGNLVGASFLTVDSANAALLPTKLAVGDGSFDFIDDVTLQMSHTFTGSSNDFPIGQFNVLHLNAGSGSATGDVYGVQLQVDTASNSRSYGRVFSQGLIDDYFGSGSVSQWNDFSTNFGNLGGGTISTSRGIFIDDSDLEDNASTITTRADIDLGATVTAGFSTIGTQYGLRIGDKTGAGTNYAIKTGFGLVSFGDKVVSSGSVTTPDIVTTPVTVSGLPTCNSSAKGAHAFVTDATATTFLSTVAGGGSNNVPVVCDGTNWKIGG
jgi:hypothetical protein